MNNIFQKLDLMYGSIANSNLYKNYVMSSEKLSKNDDIKNIILKIKRLQKIITNEYDYSIEEELKNLYCILEEYPLYQSYISFKQELEDKISEINTQFDNYFRLILKID